MKTAPLVLVAVLAPVLSADPVLRPPPPGAASPQAVATGGSLGVGPDRLAAGMDVTVSDSVAGDLMAAGAAVSVSAPVAGDLLAAGASVSATGSVGGSVRAVGGELSLSGTVGRNVTAAGGSLALARGGRVRGNLYVSGGEIALEGRVDGHVRGSAGVVRLLGRVDGSVDVTAERVVVGPDARISGDLIHRSPEPAEVAPGARIEGRTTHRPVEAPGAAGTWIVRLLRIGAFLLTGLALVAVFPGTFGRLRENLEQRPWPSLGFGLAALAALPPALAVAAVTVLGLPLALIGAGLLGAALYLSRAVVALWIGERILRRRPGRGGRAAAFLAGGALLLLAGLLPWVGWAVTLLATVAGLGAGVDLLARRTRGRGTGPPG